MEPSVSSMGQPWLLLIQVPAVLLPAPGHLAMQYGYCKLWTGKTILQFLIFRYCKTWNWVTSKKFVSPADTGHLSVACLRKVTRSVEWRILQRLTVVLNCVRNQDNWGFRCLNFSWVEWHEFPPDTSWWTLRIRDCSWNFAVECTLECSVL